METICKEYMVEKSSIGFIRFIFEAHEGIAVPTTLDSGTGHIKLAVIPEQMEAALMIVDDLKKDFKFNEV